MELLLRQSGGIQRDFHPTTNPPNDDTPYHGYRLSEDEISVLSDLATQKAKLEGALENK